MIKIIYFFSLYSLHQPKKPERSKEYQKKKKKIPKFWKIVKPARKKCNYIVQFYLHNVNTSFHSCKCELLLFFCYFSHCKCVSAVQSTLQQYIPWMKILEQCGGAHNPGQPKASSLLARKLKQQKERELFWNFPSEYSVETTEKWQRDVFSRFLYITSCQLAIYADPVSGGYSRSYLNINSWARHVELQQTALPSFLQRVAIQQNRSHLFCFVQKKNSSENLNGCSSRPFASVYSARSSSPHRA